jgi:hypothetical protein
MAGTLSRQHQPQRGPSVAGFEEEFNMKHRKQSPASAVIEASLQIAQEHAQIIASNNKQAYTTLPSTDELPLHEGAHAAVNQ